VTYNAAKQTFVVTSEAARRLTRADNSDTPFILTEHGKLVFIGVLSSFHSSRRYDFPTIYVETLSDPVAAGAQKSAKAIAFAPPTFGKRPDREQTRRIQAAMNELLIAARKDRPTDTAK
jgi:hypothetical protein